MPGPFFFVGSLGGRRRADPSIAPVCRCPVVRIASAAGLRRRSTDAARARRLDRITIDTADAMEATARYAYLWDGSQPGWVLLLHPRQVAGLRLRFSQGGPTLRDVAAVRAEVPAFAALSSRAVFAELKGRTCWSLGEFDPAAGQRLADRCTRAGLVVDVSLIDRSGYVPYNEATKMVAIIEDDEFAAAVYRAAIDHGIRIVEGWPEPA